MGAAAFDSLLFLVSLCRTQPPFRLPDATSSGSRSSRSYGGFPRQTNTRTSFFTCCARSRSSVSCACSRLAGKAAAGGWETPECRSDRPWAPCQSPRRSSNSGIDADALPSRGRQEPRMRRGARPDLLSFPATAPGPNRCCTVFEAWSSYGQWIGACPHGGVQDHNIVVGKAEGFLESVSAGVLRPA